VSFGFGVWSVKEIIAAGRAGTLDDSYRGYQDLFASAEFVTNEPGDQRQAMKIMILAKGAPRQATEAMKAAHQAAVEPLKELVRLHQEPADFELLGICHVMLGDPEEAERVFRAGLTIERERNPSSNLCGSLMKRVAG
jgi:Flp pilus assembly protein TadD